MSKRKRTKIELRRKSRKRSKRFMQVFVSEAIFCFIFTKWTLLYPLDKVCIDLSHTWTQKPTRVHHVQNARSGNFFCNLRPIIPYSFFMQSSGEKSFFKMKILASDSVQIEIAQKYADHLSNACRLEKYETIITCEDILSYFEKNRKWLKKYRSLSGTTMKSTAIFAYIKLFAEEV